MNNIPQEVISKARTREQLMGDVFNSECFNAIMEYQETHDEKPDIMEIMRLAAYRMYLLGVEDGMK